mgnify:CR=1 FL=1
MDGDLLRWLAENLSVPALLLVAVWALARETLVPKGRLLEMQAQRDTWAALWKEERARNERLTSELENAVRAMEAARPAVDRARSRTGDRHGDAA